MEECRRIDFQLLRHFGVCEVPDHAGSSVHAGLYHQRHLENAERYYEEALRLHKFHVAINLDPEVQLDPNLAETLPEHAHLCRSTAKRLKDTKLDLA